MNWTLEVVVLPISDLDRAKEFYSERLGFAVDHDTKISDDVRVIQLTPPGSACSIVFGKGIAEGTPGSIPGLQLVVNDLRKARAELVARDVEVSEITIMGPEGPQTATDEDDLNLAGFVFFTDPDGNNWSVQQINDRS
jgi:catechol 2,3-dioxygenase-like lactoylglutathione lyase family enzyme